MLISRNKIYSHSHIVHFFDNGINSTYMKYNNVFSSEQYPIHYLIRYTFGKALRKEKESTISNSWGGHLYDSSQERTDLTSVT